MGSAVSFSFGGGSNAASATSSKLGERRGSAGPRQLKSLVRDARSRLGFAEALSPERPRVSSGDVEKALLLSMRERMSESTRNLLRQHSDADGTVAREGVIAVAMGATRHPCRASGGTPRGSASPSPACARRRLGPPPDDMLVTARKAGSPREARGAEEAKASGDGAALRKSGTWRRSRGGQPSSAEPRDPPAPGRRSEEEDRPRRASFVSGRVELDPPHAGDDSPVRDEDLFAAGDRVREVAETGAAPVYVEKFVGKGSFGSVFVVRVGDLCLEYDFRL